MSIKKYISLLVLFFFCSTNLTFALSELYSVSKADINSVKAIVENEFIKNNLFIVRDNPIIGISYFGDNAAIAIVEQDNNQINYYYASEIDPSINKAILKNFAFNGYNYQKNTNQNLLNNYSSIAQKYVNAANSQQVFLDTGGNSKNITQTAAKDSRYTFDEDDNTVYSQSGIIKNDNSSVLRGRIAQISAGTKFNVYLQSAINTSTAAVGDEVIAVLTDDLKQNGATVAPQGSLVYGKLKTAKNAGYAMQNGRVIIDFYKLVTTDNVVYDISAEEIDFAVQEEGQMSGAVKTGLALAAVGALVGLLIASSSGSSHRYSHNESSYSNRSNAGKGAAIGAGVGVAAGIAGALGTKGSDAEVPSLTQLEITLTKPLSVSVTY